MNNYSRYTILFVLLAVFAVTVRSEDEKSKKEQIIEAQVDLVEQQRATKIAKAVALTKQAEDFAAKGNSKDSLKKFLAAQTLLKSVPGNLAQRKLRKLDALILTYRGRWSTALMAQARKACVLKKYSQAVKLAAEATLIDSRKANETSAFVQYCNRKIKSDAYVKKTTLTKFDKTYQKKEDDIALLHREAVILYKNKRYAEARSKIERIFIKDPYDREATFLLSKVYDKIYQVGQKRKEADLEEVEAQAGWDVMQPVLPTATRKRIKGGAEAKKDSANDLYERMQKIIFPVVEFENASIKSVIKYLSQMSKRYDPDKKGINIVSGLQSANIENGMMVDMSFSNMPMSEILRYISKYTGLKYKVENNVVVIGSGGDIDAMDVRSFKLRAAMVPDIAGVEVTGGDDNEGTGSDSGDTEEKVDLFDSENDDDNGEDFGTSDDENAPTRQLTPTTKGLLQYFEDRGINFGPRSSIAYNSRSSLLTVKNTPDNLRKLEDLLRQLDIEVPLVMVETKIIEITQTDLEELGFDWVMSVNVNKQAAGNSKWSIPENANPLRHYGGINTPNSTDAGDRQYKVVNDLKIFPNFGKSLFGKNNDVNLALTVNAIDQNKRSEILSAPKIITVSGERATIQRVREEYYPDSWEAPEIETTNGTSLLRHAVPEFDEATKIGIDFTVLPQVDPDNYTISLDLHPIITYFSGWSEYPYSATVTTRTTRPFLPPVVTGTFTSGSIKMPIISTQELRVTVKVYDGETIVIGGMVKNKSNYRDDKYPMLGELPLVGRFFRSQMSDIEKINLLIFVTARLINNDGVPVRSKNRAGTEFFR